MGALHEKERPADHHLHHRYQPWHQPPGLGWTALLQSMARTSDGKYFDVTSSGSQIVDALNAIFSEVQATNSVFASVSLPVSVNAQGTYLNRCSSACSVQTRMDFRAGTVISSSTSWATSAPTCACSTPTVSAPSTAILASSPNARAASDADRGGQLLELQRPRQLSDRRRFVRLQHAGWQHRRKGWSGLPAAGFQHTQHAHLCGRCLHLAHQLLHRQYGDHRNAAGRSR